MGIEKSYSVTLKQQKLKRCDVTQYQALSDIITKLSKYV